MWGEGRREPFIQLHTVLKKKTQKKKKRGFSGVVIQRRTGNHSAFLNASSYLGYQ